MGIGTDLSCVLAQERGRPYLVRMFHCIEKVGAELREELLHAAIETVMYGCNHSSMRVIGASTSAVCVYLLTVCDINLYRCSPVCGDRSWTLTEHGLSSSFETVR